MRPLEDQIVHMDSAPWRSFRAGFVYATFLFTHNIILILLIMTPLASRGIRLARVPTEVVVPLV